MRRHAGGFHASAFSLQFESKSRTITASNHKKFLPQDALCRRMSRLVCILQQIMRGYGTQAIIRQGHSMPL